MSEAFTLETVLAVVAQMKANSIPADDLGQYHFVTNPRKIPESYSQMLQRSSNRRPLSRMSKSKSRQARVR